MLSFLIGAQDSPYMAKEFSDRFEEKDLLALGNFQAIIKLAIDGVTQNSFLCFTLPLPNSVTQNRTKVVRLSKERYTKEVKKDESGREFADVPVESAQPEVITKK